jgi:hypothetical protein
VPEGKVAPESPVVATMSATPPVGVEKSIVVPPTVPITADAIGNVEAITISPMAGPISIVPSIPFVTEPGFTPTIHVAVASITIANIAITITICEIAITIPIT